MKEIPQEILEKWAAVLNDSAQYFSRRWVIENIINNVNKVTCYSTSNWEKVEKPDYLAITKDIVG